MRLYREHKQMPVPGHDHNLLRIHADEGYAIGTRSRITENMIQIGLGGFKDEGHAKNEPEVRTGHCFVLNTSMSTSIMLRASASIYNHVWR